MMVSPKYRAERVKIKRYFQAGPKEERMYVPLKASLALVAGVVSLLSPKLARFAVAAYLITIGVLGILGK
jgi:hypothetical protein